VKWIEALHLGHDLLIELIDRRRQRRRAEPGDAAAQTVPIGRRVVADRRDDAPPGDDDPVHQSMIPKSGHRFSEKIMLHQ
jgi:hypothetical protein